MDLGVPAVASIVSHLVGHVLSESELLLLDTALGQKQVDSGDKVAQSLVVDQTLLKM